LALSKVTFEEWFKFSYKFFIIITILGAIMAAAAQVFCVGPF